MNEEIEYAEMLEVPISTVEVTRKPRRRKKRDKEYEPAPITPLKEDLIAQINNRVQETPAKADELTQTAEPSAETEKIEGAFDFETLDRIDTIPLFSTPKKGRWWKRPRLSPKDFSLDETENDGTMYELNMENAPSRAAKITLTAEFALACAFCAGIFLTNVFMPNSAINTFFRAMNEPIQSAKVDDRSYADFTLSPVVSVLSDAELSLSSTGILSFTDACCVYPSADGKIAQVEHTGENGYVVKIKYSDTFTSVISGLSDVYYGVGDQAYANIPVGYTDGTGEVQMTMYSDGELLNCFELTEENCLAWLKTE